MALPREKEGAVINDWEVSCSDDRDILCPMSRIQDVRKRNFFGAGNGRGSLDQHLRKEN